MVNFYAPILTTNTLSSLDMLIRKSTIFEFYHIIMSEEFKIGNVYLDDSNSILWTSLASSEAHQSSNFGTVIGFSGANQRFGCKQGQGNIA